MSAGSAVVDDVVGAVQLEHIAVRSVAHEGLLSLASYDVATHEMD